MTEKSQIVTGDALNVLRRISDNYIDCCVTSPPYYGLRDYGIDGQVGLEENPQEYVDKMVEIFREVRRTLRPDGTLWLNIGDSYAGSGKGRMGDGSHSKDHSISSDYLNIAGGKLKTTKPVGCKRKDLIGIPWLLAFALREDGWYLRQDIIWNKPNAMPESVKDRCTKSHEYIFLLTKSDKYYFDYEAIREPAVGFDNRPPAGSRGAATPNSRRRKGNAKTFRGGGAYTGGRSFNNSDEVERESHGNEENTTGLRNRRSVWNVATQGYAKAHFATFPEKLIEPCILAGSRPGGIILDPFLGSGTTAVVAVRNGRDYIGIDLNPEYTEMAKSRVAIVAGGVLIVLEITPITLRQANEFVTKYHRHHKPSRGHKFSIGVCEDGRLVGVCICGRPVSRHLDDGKTLEVNRLCTDGTYNACSILYAAAYRAATAMGYKRVITYILESEPGTSLKAAGYKCEGKAGGLEWNGRSKPKNENQYPREMKTRWVREKAN